MLVVVAVSGMWVGGAWGTDGVETYEVISYHPICTAMRIDDRESITRLDTVRQYSLEEMNKGIPIRIQVSNDTAAETLRWLLNLQTSFDRYITASIRNIDNDTSTVMTNPNAIGAHYSEGCYAGVGAVDSLHYAFLHREFIKSIGATVGAVDVQQFTSASDFDDKLVYSDSGISYLPPSTGYARVEIYTVRGTNDIVKQYLDNNGAFPYDVGCDDDACSIRAVVPSLILGKLSEMDSVIWIDTVLGPAIHGGGGFGNVVTEGLDDSIRSWHGKGHTGNGIAIGVIDSGGFVGIGESIKKGDLPADTKCLNNMDSITACDRGRTEYPRHGTMVAEIVMDMAPGAKLYVGLSDLDSSVYDLTDLLLDVDVDVIVYSGTVVAFEGPGDGSDYVKNGHLDAIKLATDAGAVWINAAGNYNERTWYTDDPQTEEEGGFLGFGVKNMITFKGNDTNNPVHLEVGKQYIFTIRWQGDWTTVNQPTNILLHLKSTNKSLADHPIQPMSTTNPTVTYTIKPAYTGKYNLQLELKGDKPDWIQVMSFNADLTYTTEDTPIGKNSYNLGNNGEQQYRTSGR